VVSLLSTVISAMRLPISCTSSMAWWPHEPAVSIIIIIIIITKEKD